MYMTKDFAKMQKRKFTVYYNDKEDKVAEERKLQQEEHENRSTEPKEDCLKDIFIGVEESSEKKKSKKVK